MSDETKDLSQFNGTDADKYADVPTANVENGIETFNNRITTTIDLAIDEVLNELGYPLVNVELSRSQFLTCFSNAIHIYTKYATFPERYLYVDFKDYDHVKGINLKHLNVSQVKEINFIPYQLLGMTTSELCFGMSGYVVNTNMWNNFDFVSVECVMEYKKMAERMLYPKPDWTYNNVTGQLLLYPDPRKIFSRGRYMIDVNSIDKLPAALTVEIEPPLEELYSNEAVKTIAYGYAKMMLGEIRGKFSNISLPGGGQLANAEALRTEGQTIVNGAIEDIQKHASFGNHFVIV